MKKLFVYALCLTYSLFQKTNAQLKPTTYLTGDMVATYHTDSFHGNRPQAVFINPGFYQTIGKGNFGFFIEAVLEKDVFSYAPGIMLAFQMKNTYWESGGGPGFEKPWIDGEGKELTYANFYSYLETYADTVKGGKVIISANFSYSKEWDEKLWRYVYVTVYLNKWLALRAQTMSYGTTGIGLVLMPAKGLNFYAIAGTDSKFDCEQKRFSAGMSFTMAKVWKGRSKK